MMREQRWPNQRKRKPASISVILLMVVCCSGISAFMSWSPLSLPIAWGKQSYSMLKYTWLCSHGQGTGVEISHSIQRGPVLCYLGNQFRSEELLCSVLPNWGERKMMRWRWKGLELLTTISTNPSWLFSLFDGQLWIYMCVPQIQTLLYVQIMSINPQIITIFTESYSAWFT